MKRIHLLRFGGAPVEIAPLASAARAEGLRVGWLEPPGSEVEPAPVPSELAAASGAGAFRAVALGTGRSVAVKRLTGPPNLRDVLREHFLGCALVVVSTATAGPAASGLGSDLGETATLEAVEDGYRVTLPGEAGRVFTAPALAGRLRRPRPWE